MTMGDIIPFPVTAPVEPPPAPTPPKPPKRKKRRHSGTAAWHMSAAAVDISLGEVYQMSEMEAINFLVECHFGGWDTVRCPTCGTIDPHYWRPIEARWKCACCRWTFSVMSNTLFANHKLSLVQIIANSLMWVNSVPGQPALELKRHGKTMYSTAFTHQHKLREGILRGYNVGILAGEIEMDGAHQTGWRADEKRGKPQITQPFNAKTDIKDLNAAMLTQTAQVKARQKQKRLDGKLDPEFRRVMPKNRRILLVMKKRHIIRGKGAVSTRVAVGLVEDSPVARSVMASFVAKAESRLNTDTSPAYTELGRDFLEHRTVEHSKMLIGPNGENNNQAEETNFRYDRAEKGIHLNIEAKYMLDYAVETAFRADTRRIPNKRQLMLVLNLAMSVGESLFWKNFTHGKHREVELTHPLPLPAPSSGPAKKKHPVSQVNGRPPR